jgi:hypothetical protein
VEFDLANPLSSDELAELRNYCRDEEVQCTESRLSMALPMKWFKNAWCSTVHKAQGRGVEHVFFVRKAKPYYKAGCLLYTAYSRAKKSLTLIGPYSFFTSSLAVAPEMTLTMLGKFLGSDAAPIQHARTVEEGAARQRRQGCARGIPPRARVPKKIGPGIDCNGVSIHSRTFKPFDGFHFVTNRELRCCATS